MKFESFLRNLRVSKRPDVNIMEIAEIALSDDFSLEQCIQLDEFPIKLMTKDEKLTLTQSLSTFNSESSKNEYPSSKNTGAFRFRMLNKLFASDGAEELMNVANATESKYQSTMVPYLIGKHSTNEELLKSVLEKSPLGNENHRIGIVHNHNAPESAIRYTYDYMKEHAVTQFHYPSENSYIQEKQLDVNPITPSDGLVDIKDEFKPRQGLNPLENIYIPVKQLVENPNTPLDVLVNIQYDFKHIPGAASSLYGLSEETMAEKLIGVAMPTDGAIRELNKMDASIEKDADGYAVIKSSKPKIHAHVSLNDKTVEGLDKIPKPMRRSVEAYIYNDHNDNILSEIQSVHTKRLLTNFGIDLSGLEELSELEDSLEI